MLWVDLLNGLKGDAEKTSAIFLEKNGNAWCSYEDSTIIDAWKIFFCKLIDLPTWFENQYVMDGKIHRALTIVQINCVINWFEAVQKDPKS